MGRHSRLRLDLEAVVEDASDEVYTFQILKSLIYSKFVGGCTKSQTSTESYKNLTSYQNPSRGRIILRNPIVLSSYLSIRSEAFIYIFKSSYTL